jgi:dipeptidyl aminopeptidase/acylaminoacyl peptidase
MKTVEYAPGRLVDVFGNPAQQTVLLWHGQQSDARTALRPLAALVADHGLAVLVPDWNSHAHDGGRADLLRSMHFARDRVEDPDSLVLAGWSMGGVAAAALTIQAGQLGIRFGHTVCLAGAFMVPDPIFGRMPSTELPSGGGRWPFTLLHGLSDHVIPIAVSREFASVLRRNGWPVELVELPADHGSIAGARYEAAADRYVAADDAETLAVAADVAARIAALAS